MNKIYLNYMDVDYLPKVLYHYWVDNQLKTDISHTILLRLQEDLRICDGLY